MALDPNVQSAIVTGGFTTVVAVLGIVAETLRRQGRRLTEVHEQVKNTHETNLREDMDRMLHKMDDLHDMAEQLVEGQRRHDAEIAGLRQDLRVEREERLALAKLLTGGQ